MKSKTTRRQWLANATKAALAYPVFNMSLGMISCGGGGKGGSRLVPPPNSGYTGTDDQLMDEIQRAAFDFFWTEASSTTGQIKDRALAVGGDTRDFASIASTGFGLTALCIGDKRGYGDSAKIKQRVIAALDFLANQMPNEHGFFYHFVHLETGERFNNNVEVSNIDTSILLCGILFARQYYNDPQITALANTIYQRMDWPWFLNGGTTFSMGWKPDSGFLEARWDHYCELMMIYLLAIGSPTHPVSPDTWKAWSRPPISYQGYNFIYGDSPLFVHQFSHAWFDFRNKSDEYANYFQNSIDATKAHKLFCLSLKNQFSDYSDNLWGITASDYSGGYTAWGGPPAKGPIDGTVVPCATAGSLPFVFSDCIAVLRNIRSTYGSLAWKKYGFVDAFNPLTNWYDADVIGIDQGISMLMCENQRTGMVWQVFNTAPEVQNAMSAVGFKPALR
ncbi:MAG TPA: glucoamylase family protein [Terriglobales bacterium]|nr:glucoamylase family protein [Terriglobales bacterium]